MALRRVYFSFDYERDLHRVKQIYELPDIVSRSAGGFQSPAVWRQAKAEGDASVRGLINDALIRTSVTVVCIGFQTSSGIYLDHEIERSLNQGNGLLGIEISRIPDQDGLVDPYAHVPPAIEEAGFNVYPYTSRDQLISQIDEAVTLAQLDHAERLDRKLERAEIKVKKEPKRKTREDVVDGSVDCVTIGGEVYPIRHWNSQGFVAMFYDGDLREGDTVDIFFSAELAERKLEFNCQAKIRWTNGDAHEIGASFVGMDDDVKAIIRRRSGAN